MLLPEVSWLSVEILLKIIINQYLTTTCFTVVSEIPINFVSNGTFIYIQPNSNDFDQMVNQILEVSEIGCSDYIVLMKEPKSFMIALEQVNHLGTVRRSDRKVIMFPHGDEHAASSLLDVLAMRETGFLVNILLVLPKYNNGTECDIYDLVTHKYVGTDAEADQPLYLDRWDSCTESFVHNNNLFPHNMSNLYGKTVKVAAFTYKPYAILDINPDVERLGRDGIEIRIVDEFCRWINCTIEITRDDEHEWGEIYENGTGVGVLGNVVEDRADLAITALYSWYEEFRVLDFSVAGVRTAITCVAPAPRLLASWEMPLMPFSWYMWLGLVITFLYSSIALGIAKGSTDKVFLMTFGMMITQSQNDAGTSWRIRSITGWLLMTGLVLDNAYGGGLASTFTVPKYEQSIDTVHDVVERKMEWGATHDAWIFSLALSQEPLVKQLVRQFRIYTADQLKKKSFTRSMAFSIEKLPAGYFAIGEYITKEAVLDMTILLEDFYYEQCVVMLRKSSPYTEKINEVVGRLHESGLMMAWETQVALKYLDYEVQLEVKLSRSKKDVDNAEPLGLRHVMGIFFIYFFGVSVSILYFIVEIVLGNRKKNSFGQDTLIVIE